MASPQPGPACSSLQREVAGCFRPPRDPAGSSPQGPGAVTAGISSFMTCHNQGPQGTRPTLHCCLFSIGAACSQPLWNATSTCVPLAQTTGPDTGQGAEQGPEGEEAERRREDRGDEAVSQEARKQKQGETERSQPWGDKTGGLKSPKQLLGGPPPWNPQTSPAGCLSPVALSMGLPLPRVLQNHRLLHIHDLCIWVTMTNVEFKL